MTSANFFFVPVEEGVLDTATRKVTPRHVGNMEMVQVSNGMVQAITNNDVKKAIESYFRGMGLEATIGGAENWNRCYLAKLDAKDGVDSTNARTVVIAGDFDAPQGNYLKLKLSAILEANDEDRPLALVYPAKPPAGNPLFFLFFPPPCLFE